MAEEGHNNQQTAETTTTTTDGGIIGTVKSYLGLDDKTVANIQDTAASTADAYLPESLKPAAVKGAAGTSSTDDTAAESAAATTTETSAPADPSTDKSEDASAPKEETTTATAGDSSADNKDDAPADADADADKSEDKPSSGGNTSGNTGKPRENPEAIPTAGGQKLGEEHWGESKVVPDVPKDKDEPETSGGGVASEAGQPTEEVKSNTAQNVGSATAPPVADDSAAAAAATPADEDAVSPTRSESGTEKKGKLMDRLKSKFKKDKA